MEHIVQFAVGIDDEGIRKRIIETSEKQIIDRLYEECKSAVIRKSRRYWNFENKDEKIKIVLNDLVFEAVDKMVTEHKDEIIDNASKILADRIGRTKAARETFRNIVESEVSEK